MITLRTQFGKAKVRTINAITRKLKAIEHGKEKDPKNNKLDKKSAKLTEELTLLKVRSLIVLHNNCLTYYFLIQQATKLEMVKKVFVFSGNPDKTLKLANASVEDRAISRLLLNDFLNKSITEIKKKLELKEGDKEWQTMLFETGKNKKKKLKKEKFAAIDAAKAKKQIDMTPEEKKQYKKDKKREKKRLEKANNPTKHGEKKKKKFDQIRKQFIKPKGAAGKARDTSSSTPKDAAVKAPNDVSVKKPKDASLKKSKDDSVKKQKEIPIKKQKDTPIKKQKDSATPKLKDNRKREAKPENAENLHPSWKAKKQNKPAISKFEGKRTKFD